MTVPRLPGAITQGSDGTPSCDEQAPGARTWGGHGNLSKGSLARKHHAAAQLSLHGAPEGGNKSPKLWEEDVRWGITSDAKTSTK